MTAQVEGIHPPAPGEGGHNQLPVSGILAQRVQQDERRSVRRTPCGVTQQSMSSVLTNMESKELIRREASPVHAKVQIATLTDKGQAVLERAYQEVIVLERALTDAFTPSEHTALCELLERATTVLVQQTRQATGPSIA
jgi:DNA-binding PadR family transcriptional regulator